MSLKPNIPAVEKISSFIVIVVLIITFLLVLYLQSYFDPAEFGFEPLLAEDSTPMPKTPFDLQAGVPKGWVFLGRLERYDAQHLYEKINGKAPLYLESGFVRLYTQKIVHSTDSDNWAEIYIYDMANGENAFSVFSVQRRSNAVSIEELDAGYRAENAAFAAIGRYYLEIIGSNVSQPTVDAVKASALNFTAAGEAQSGEPSFLRLFPAENLLAETVTLAKRDAFGFERFRDTYIGRYDIDGESITAFVIVCADAAAAAELSGAYRSFLLANGFRQADAAGTVAEGVYEYSGIYEVIFSEGKFVGGIHEAFDRTAAEELAVKMTGIFEEIDDAQK